MITRDHETVVMPGKAFMGFVSAYRGAIAALRRAGAEGAAHRAEEALTLYVDWICGDQPQIQAEFFTRYFDKMLDPQRIGALIVEDLAERLAATVDKQTELDAASARRADWVRSHPDQLR